MCECGDAPSLMHVKNAPQCHQISHFTFEWQAGGSVQALLTGQRDGRAQDTLATPQAILKGRQVGICKRANCAYELHIKLRTLEGMQKQVWRWPTASLSNCGHTRQGCTTARRSFFQGKRACEAMHSPITSRGAVGMLDSRMIWPSTCGGARALH